MKMSNKIEKESLISVLEDDDDDDDGISYYSALGLDRNPVLVSLMEKIEEHDRKDACS